MRKITRIVAILLVPVATLQTTGSPDVWRACLSPDPIAYSRQDSFGEQAIPAPTVNFVTPTATVTQERAAESSLAGSLNTFTRRTFFSGLAAGAVVLAGEKLLGQTVRHPPSKDLRLDKLVQLTEELRTLNNQASEARQKHADFESISHQIVRQAVAILQHEEWVWAAMDQENKAVAHVADPFPLNGTTLEDMARLNRDVAKLDPSLASDIDNFLQRYDAAQEVIDRERNALNAVALATYFLSLAYFELKQEPKALATYAELSKLKHAQGFFADNGESVYVPVLTMRVPKEFIDGQWKMLAKPQIQAGMKLSYDLWVPALQGLLSRLPNSPSRKRKPSKEDDQIAWRKSLKPFGLAAAVIPPNRDSRKAIAVGYLSQKFAAELIQPQIEELDALLEDRAATFIEVWADTWRKTDAHWFSSASTEDLQSHAIALLNALEAVLMTQRASHALLYGAAETWVQNAHGILFIWSGRGETDPLWIQRLSKLNTELNRQKDATAPQKDRPATLGYPWTPRGEEFVFRFLPFVIPLIYSPVFFAILLSVFGLQFAHAIPLFGLNVIGIPFLAAFLTLKISTSLFAREHIDRINPQTDEPYTRSDLPKLLEHSRMFTRRFLLVSGPILTVLLGLAYHLRGDRIVNIIHDPDPWILWGYSGFACIAGIAGWLASSLCHYAHNYRVIHDRHPDPEALLMNLGKPAAPRADTSKAETLDPDAHLSRSAQATPTALPNRREAMQKIIAGILGGMVPVNSAAFLSDFFENKLEGMYFFSAGSVVKPLFTPEIIKKLRTINNPLNLGKFINVNRFEDFKTLMAARTRMRGVQASPPPEVEAVADHNISLDESELRRWEGEGGNLGTTGPVAAPADSLIVALWNAFGSGDESASRALLHQIQNDHVHTLYSREFTVDDHRVFREVRQIENSELATEVERITADRRDPLTQAQAAINVRLKNLGLSDDECHAVRLALSGPIENLMQHVASRNRRSLVALLRQARGVAIYFVDAGPGMPVQMVVTGKFRDIVRGGVGKGIQDSITAVDEAPRDLDLKFTLSSNSAEYRSKTRDVVSVPTPPSGTLFALHVSVPAVPTNPAAMTGELGATRSKGIHGPKGPFEPPVPNTPDVPAAPEGRASPVGRAAAPGKTEGPFAHLRWLKEAFYDAIPTKIVDGTDLEYKFYKVRKNWWQGVIADLDNILSKALIVDPVLVSEINEFIVKYLSDAFRDRLTTAEDIGEVNQLIDRVLPFQTKKSSDELPAVPASSHPNRTLRAA